VFFDCVIGRGVRFSIVVSWAFACAFDFRVHSIAWYLVAFVGFPDEENVILVSVSST